MRRSLKVRRTMVVGGSHPVVGNLEALAYARLDPTKPSTVKRWTAPQVFDSHRRAVGFTPHPRTCQLLQGAVSISILINCIDRDRSSEILRSPSSKQGFT
jgi:hypothetical protein